VKELVVFGLDVFGSQALRPSTGRKHAPVQIEFFRRLEERVVSCRLVVWCSVRSTVIYIYCWLGQTCPLPEASRCSRLFPFVQSTSGNCRMWPVQAPPSTGGGSSLMRSLCLLVCFVYFLLLFIFQSHFAFALYSRVDLFQQRSSSVILHLLVLGLRPVYWCGDC